MIEVARNRRIVSAMRLVLLLSAVIGGLFQSGCASSSDDPDQVKLGPSIREQQKEARKTEEFARELPQPRG